MTVTFKETRQGQCNPSGVSDTLSIQTPNKALRFPNSRKLDGNPHTGWVKMMSEIKELGSPVPVLRIYKKAGNLTKENVVGTLMRFKQTKDWKAVAEIIEWLRQQSWWAFTELDHNLLITAYGKLGEPEKVERALRIMKKAGVTPSVAPYTSLIEAYGRKRFFEKAESIFNKMLEEGPSPTALTYQTIIGALIKGDKFGDAERIFSSISEVAGANVKLDQKLCNLMIHCYGKSGKVDEASRLSRKMKAMDIPLSVVTFNSLISCQPCVKDAENVFRQMQRAKIEPDVFSYTSRIKAFSKARRADEAHYFFKAMVKSGIRPNRAAYNALLDAFATSKMVEEAQSIFKQMKRERCSPDLLSYTTLMNAYVNVSNMDKAQQVLEQMKMSGIQPNIISYGTLIKGYAEKGDLDGMVNKYKEMLNEDIRPNQTVFTIMINAFGRQDSLDTAILWFKEMIAAGLAPDERARNTLIELSRAADRKQEALDLIESLG